MYQSIIPWLSSASQEDKLHFKRAYNVSAVGTYVDKLHRSGLADGIKSTRRPRSQASPCLRFVSCQRVICLYPFVGLAGGLELAESLVYTKQRSEDDVGVVQMLGSALAPTLLLGR